MSVASDSVAPDIGVYDAENRPILVAEVKGKPDSSTQWAAQLRRNLAAHASFPDARYFLVVTPNTIYLWTRPVGTELAPADATFDARVVLKPYLDQFRDPRNLTETALEIMVAAWLDSLIDGYGRSKLSPEVHDRLEEAGLLKALQGARLEQS